MRVKKVRFKDGRVFKYFDMVIPFTKKQVEQWVGKPCPDYEKDCLTCKSWAQWKATRCITLYADRDLMVKRIFSGESL